MNKIEIVVGYKEDSKMLQHFNKNWLYTKPVEEIEVEEIEEILPTPVLKFRNLIDNISTEEVKEKESIGMNLHPRVAEIPVSKILAKSNEYIKVIDSRSRTVLFELQALKGFQLKVLEDFLKGHIKQIEGLKWL